jgi:opacity protein-like surface antigen
VKRLVLLCAFVVGFAGVASAQDVPKVDVFGGYSFAYLRANGAGASFNGGSASGAYNTNSWLGLVGDFGGYHTDTDGESGNLFTYLFGPRITFRRGKVTPFVQTLIGAGHLTGPGFSKNAFAMTAGGGLDWNASEHLSIRVAQLEYFMTRFGNTQNGVRVSTGVVFHF